MPSLEQLMAAGGQPVAAADPGVAPTPAAVGGTSFSLEQLMAAGGQAMPDEQPGRLEALGRGALQGVSLGFSDEIAGAIGSLFSDKSYSQIRDESRAANEAAKQAHGGFYLGGELTGGVASALLPGLNIAKGASVAAAAGKAALAGGLSGIGSSDKSTFGGVAMDAAKAAAAGAVIGGGLQKLGQVVSHAPEKAKENLLNLVTRGDGMHGGATPTAQKALVENKANVIEALTQKFEVDGAAKPMKLSDIIGKPAKEVLPWVEERLNAVDALNDVHYDVVDKATKGVSLGSLVEHLDAEVARLKKSPLNENYVRAVEDIKKSALDAWAPEMQQNLDNLKRMRSMGLKVEKGIEDVHVPTRDLRDMVTRIQQRGSQVINPMNPGESVQMKRDMGSLMKDFIDSHLDAGGERSPEIIKAVEAIRENNKILNGLKSVEKALIQRGQKEAVGGTSLKAHGFNLLGHGGLLGAGLMAAHGNIPGAILAAAGPKVLEKATTLGPRAFTSGAVKANTLIEQLTQAAAQGNPWAKAKLAAMDSVQIGASNIAGQEMP